MQRIFKKYRTRKFLSQNFGKRQFVHSSTIRNSDENVEIYGYKGAVILIKEVGDTVLYRLPKFEH